MDFRFRPVFGHFATPFEGETTSKPGIKGKVNLNADAERCIRKEAGVLGLAFVQCIFVERRK